MAKKPSGLKNINEMRLRENNDHPMQPIVFDDDGTARFKENKIITWLLKNKRITYDELDTNGFEIEDLMQFFQLRGYSVDGFAEIFEGKDNGTIGVADIIVENLK